MTFGAKLQTLRTEAGLSQEALAARLGVSRQAVSKWELDKTVPDAATIVAVSELFRVSTDYLLKDEAPAVPPHTVPEIPETPPQETPMRPLSCLLLEGGNALFAALLLLYLGFYCFGFHRPGTWPLLIVLLAAPVLLVAAHGLLTADVPLQRFRRSFACCTTLWGLALALLFGFSEVVDDLLVSQVEGLAGILLFLILCAALLVPLWCAGWVLAKRLTKPSEV